MLLLFSEIIELNLPSILLPYDFVGQTENADILEVNDCAKVYNNENVETAIQEAIKINLQ